MVATNQVVATNQELAKPTDVPIVNLVCAVNPMTKKELELVFKNYKHSNLTQREFYIAQTASIPEKYMKLFTQGCDPMAAAEGAYLERHQFRVKTREVGYLCDKVGAMVMDGYRYGHHEGPTFSQVIEKYKINEETNHARTPYELATAIISSSERTNEKVNAFVKDQGIVTNFIKSFFALPCLLADPWVEEWYSVPKG